MSRYVRAVAAAFAVALVPTALLAQAEGTISGQVTDRATQRPLADVQVIVVGTQLNATSNQQGRYAIRGVLPGSYEIRARRVGYAPSAQRMSVQAGVTLTLDFALTESLLQLEEVVVSAVTGQQERRVEMGTNVGTVNVAQLEKGPITKMADVLQGRVAGVTLQTSVGTSGGGQRVRIRGANSLSLSNEPLVYIDGIRASNNKSGFTLGGQDYSRLNDINPEEIESVDVLKGPAAAAMYGSAAANGVILITTRKGRAGAPVWRSWAEASQMKDVAPYPLNYAALTQLGNGTEPYYRDDIDGRLNITTWITGAPYRICPNYLAAAGTCTQDVLLSFDQFRDARTTPLQTGTRHKLGTSVSGGSDAVSYFISADQEKELGVLRPNDVDRTSLRTNLTTRIGSKVSGGVTAAYIRSNTLRMSNDNSIFSPLINALLGPAQYVPGMESDTVLQAGSRMASYFGYNTADQRKVTVNQLVDRFVVGSNASYTPLGWLRFHGNLGLDYFGRFDRQTQNPNELPLAQSYILGFRSAQRANHYLWTSSASAAATFEPLPGMISTSSFGGAFERALTEFVFCQGQGIPAGTNSCAATTSQFAVDEGHTDLKTVGVFFRQELALNDKLFLSGSFRADNNSGLVREVSGLSYYPAFNASWLVSREGWFPQLGILSQFRLRGGWGQAGQRPGFGDAETFYGSRVAQVGTNNQPALILTSTGNPNLKVERTTEYEGGFDAGWFNHRITTEFTFFNRRSQDALVQRNLAPSAGLTGSVWQNLGSVKNWGTEIGVVANVVESDRFRFDARLTAATLKNRIEDLGRDIAPIQLNRGRQQHREGFPTGAYMARPIKWADADGNGKLSVSEVSVDSSKFLILPNRAGGLDTLPLAFVGPILPTNSQTLGLDVTLLRNITLTSVFERRAGHYQMNETEYFRCRTLNSNPWVGQCGALSNPNASLESQAAYIAAQQNAAAFGATPYGYIEKADFIKWRELSIRFGVPETVSDRFAALRGAGISFSGRNIKTWTDYTGIDPEINEGGGNNFTQAEFNTQPIPRVFTLRLDFRL